MPEGSSSEYRTFRLPEPCKKRLSFYKMQMISHLEAKLLIKIPGIKHGFLTCEHSFSKDNAQKNEDTLSALSYSLGAQREHFITLEQVHSAKVLNANDCIANEPLEADALVSNKPRLFLAVLTADCVPILLASSDGKIVGAIHAGWRGARAGVIENTLELMRSLGDKEIMAALGPCIWQESYEVKEDFRAQFPNDGDFFIPGSSTGHWYFDLPAYVSQRLRQAGVKQIEASLANTYTNLSFNSCRRSLHTKKPYNGNNISFISIGQ
jgi:YfiH family protein